MIIAVYLWYYHNFITVPEKAPAMLHLPATFIPLSGGLYGTAAIPTMLRNTGQARFIIVHRFPKVFEITSFDFYQYVVYCNTGGVL